MIYIEERQTTKQPGQSSLYISFSYNQKIVDIIKNHGNCTYNKKTFEWEVVTTNLSKLVNELGYLDDIKLTVLPTQEKHIDKVYPIDTYAVTPYKYQLDGVLYGLNHDCFLLLDAPGLGKAVTLDTKVATPNGFIPIKDVHSGDLVFDNLGNPVSVIAEYNHAKLNMYDITFSNGHTIRCCEDHLWKIEFSHARNTNSPDYIKRGGVYKTSELLAFSKKKLADAKLPLCKPVKYSKKTFDIHPYILGVILGDGHVSKTGLTEICINDNDLDIVEKITQLLPNNIKLNRQKKTGRGENCTDFSFVKNDNHIGIKNSFNQSLIKLGLNGKTASTKFIPKEYLYGSIEQRKELIRGLFDTDGSGGTMLEFCSASKQLSLDVIELIESIGGWCKLTTKTVGASIYYRITIRYDNLADLFFTQRKKEKSLTKHRWSKVIRITSIKPAGVFPGKCITVDSPDHLYLLEHYIVTHNTILLTILAEELKKRDDIEHCLVICGINTLKTNWIKELAKYGKSSARILGLKISKKGNLSIGSVLDRINELKNPINEFYVITNVETLRNDEIINAINNGPNNFDIIIYDEIHTVKDPSSLLGHNLLKLTKAKHRIGATGTLIMNNPIDSYVALKWIGAENSTYTNFKSYYCTFGGPFHNILTGFKNTKILKEQLEMVSLRRTKDLLDLPPKTIINEYVDMSDNLLKFYDAIKQGIKDLVDKVKLTTTNLLSLVTRLRLATACPNILTSENILSAKIDRAVELAEQIVDNGNKCVIFSTFKEPCTVLELRLKKYNPLVSTGDTKDDTISTNIDQFLNNPEAKIFLGTWSKCGTGITLTAASYMIFIDTPWTDAVYELAQDRIYRIGTKDSVFIYNLITAHTIDERVLEIVNDKAAISDYIVDDKITENSIESLRKYIEEL